MQAHAPQPVVPGVDRDTEYVASLLSGHPSVQTTTRGHAHKKKPRKIAQPQHQATPSASSDPLVAQYSKPSNKSHSQQYFCEACTCWVAAREHAWNTHITGIKHQRQLVSLQHTGQLGNVLVSVFEAVPEPVDREQESTAASAPLPPVCPIHGERLARLRTAALKNIVNLSARPSDAQRMAEHYLPQKLSEAWTNASHHHTRAIQHCGGELELLEFVPNQIVCLADLMKESCKITSFKLKGTQSTDCKQHPEDAMAVQLLLQALRSQMQLQVVKIHLHSLPRPELLQRQPQSGWGHTLAIFHPLWKQLNCILRHGLWLRHLAVTLPALHHGTVSGFLEDAKQHAVRAQSSRKPQLATAILMGAHSRLGADSWLRQLPNHILQDIVRLSVPQEPCHIIFACQNS